MCYNCGCGIPDDDMGKGNLRKGGGGFVEDDILHLAQVWNMTEEEVKDNIYKLLKKQLDK